ncbi:HpcH/HpaI aldolase/citrate lyase family protein [Roseateles sp. DC23W]|uniref:HpcH/HpaI aldolase/citrate lyase family protein n=2 Tax=Pelomonas dachongensis TaxID=3299029 RepID=A0ABW7ETY3_9BURK
MRSKLFVPAIRPELFAKALASAADAISIDLEDAVPESRKEEARNEVGRFLSSPALRGCTKQIIVRVNAAGTPHFLADLHALTGSVVHMLNLPKPQSAGDVRAAIQAMDAAHLAADTTVLANIETPVALRRAAEIAGAHPRVVGLQLGLGDLFEPAGIDRRTAANVHAAMFQLSLAAAETGIFCCDGAYPNVKDVTGFRAEAAMAHALGFVGKSCIHPSQIAMANEIFQPDPAQIEQARRIVSAADAAAASGRAAFLVDGQMIDPPFLQRARRLLLSVQGKQSSP